jgi:hypothetical protein
MIEMVAPPGAKLENTRTYNGDCRRLRSRTLVLLVSNPSKQRVRQGRRRDQTHARNDSRSTGASRLAMKVRRGGD